MSPETAVARLADLMAARPEFTEDELYAAMAEAGVPDSVADRAYKFTQIAWGRVFLDGMGIQFALDYFCLDAAGGVMESGLLVEQPYFIAAMALAKGQPAGLTRLAVMSADVSAVNDALKARAAKSPDGPVTAEGLVSGPPVLFMEPPTPAGIVEARRIIADRLAHPKT